MVSCWIVCYASNSRTFFDFLWVSFGSFLCGLETQNDQRSGICLVTPPSRSFRQVRERQLRPGGSQRHSHSLLNCFLFVG